MTNEVAHGVIDAAEGAVRQIITRMDQWPVAVLVVAVLLVFGIMLRMNHVFPNRLVPSVMLLVGGFSYAFLGNVKEVPPDQRYPMALLFFKGFLLGFIAWILLSTVWRMVEKKYPVLSGQNGNTMLLRKEDVEDEPRKPKDQ